MPVVISAAAAFPELWPALAVLFIVYAALVMFGKPIVALLSNVPVIGGAIGGAVYGAIGTLIDWGLSWADQYVLPVLEMVAAPVAQLVDYGREAVAFAETMAGQLAGATLQLGQAVAGATSTALNAWGQAIAALGAATLALTTARAVQSTATRIEAVVIPAAAAHAVALAEANADARIGAEATTRAAVDTSTAAALSAEHYARTVAVNALDTWRTGTVDPTLRNLERGIEGVGALVGPLVAAQLIARTSTLESTLAQVTEECIAPVCNAIKPELSLLGLLGSGALLLAVGALVGEAVRDPQGAARATIGLVGGIEGEAAGVIGAIAGVKV